MIEAPTPLPVQASTIPRGEALRRGLRDNPLLVAGAVMSLLVVLVALFAPLLAPYPADAGSATHPFIVLHAPSAQHWFGTDNVGRDILSRVIYGARVSPVIAVFVLLIACVIGIPLGAAAGYFGGWLDEAIMRVTDIFLAFPPLLLALAFAAVLPPSLTSLIIAILLIVLQTRGQYSTKLIVPFFKQFRPDLVIENWAHNPHLWPLAFLPFVIFVCLVIVGSSNAVNLTDGLDGLAIGCTVIAAGALTVLTYVSGHATFASYLELQRMPQIGELTIFCGAMVGSAIGFLWYNAHPAEVFMGDVGSLALGGAIGTVAVMIKQELLLPFIGGVFVIEALSVILQVASYKLRKKRIFKMAPIHHHFELLGWSESKVIVRFWIASLVFALFALTTLKLR